MLILGLSLLNVLGAIRYTQILFLGNLYKITINYIWVFTLTCVFSWLPNRVASYFFTMNHSRSMQLLVNHHLFWIPSREKEEFMFYVANVITFSVVSDLLWECTSIVHYSLNRFQPPLVNQFYICTMWFGGCARFIVLDQIVLYE